MLQEATRSSHSTVTWHIIVTTQSGQFWSLQTWSGDFTLACAGRGHKNYSDVADEQQQAGGCTNWTHVDHEEEEEDLKHKVTQDVQGCFSCYNRFEERKCRRSGRKVKLGSSKRGCHIFPPNYTKVHPNLATNARQSSDDAICRCCIWFTKIRFLQLQLKAENLNGITLMTSLPILDQRRLSAHICCRACWESCASNLYISEVLRSCTYLLRHLLTCLQVVVLLLFLFFFSSWVAVATDLLVSVPARSTGRRCE